MKEFNNNAKSLAWLLAEEYALGWKGHAEHFGEPPGMPAKVWANCNWEAFAEKAISFLRVKKEKPDPDVVVPTYQYLTEGYNPDDLPK